jgi:hypothetical protein
MELARIFHVSPQGSDDLKPRCPFLALFRTQTLTKSDGFRSGVTARQAAAVAPDKGENDLSDARREVN